MKKFWGSIFMMFLLIAISQTIIITNLQFAYSNYQNKYSGTAKMTDNGTLTSENLTIDKSCTKIPNQYTVTLNDTAISNPHTLNNTLEYFINKTSSLGAHVVDIFRSIGIFVINSTDAQLLVQVIEELRDDSRIESVQQSVCVSASDTGS